MESVVKKLIISIVFQSSKCFQLSSIPGLENVTAPTTTTTTTTTTATPAASGGEAAAAAAATPAAPPAEAATPAAAPEVQQVFLIVCCVNLLHQYRLSCLCCFFITGTDSESLIWLISCIHVWVSSFKLSLSSDNRILYCQCSK